MSRIKDAFDAVAAAIIAQKDYLSDIDAKAGDGDHGFNMARGFRAAQEKVDEMDDTSLPGPVLIKIGKALIQNVGGAAGPLYGAAFVKAGEACDEETRMNIKSFEKLLAAAIEAIQSRGRAEQGDKTILDALIPIHDCFLPENVEDKNLLGVLCSKIADTYTGTMDYAQASSYIDESIEYFRQCGRKDQEAIELLRKSFNLTRRRLWDQADSCFKELLSIKSLEKGLRNRALVGYGMFLLNNPDPDEKLALSILSSAIEEGGKLEKLSQVYAYAYLLKTQGMETESEALMRMADRFKTKDEYSYHYWKYREYLKSGDMIAAHSSLWAAMNVMDSIRIRSYEGSAANSQRSFLELTVSAQELRIRARKREIIIISLLCLVIALASSVVYQLNKAALQRKKEEKERMEMLVERLEEQVKDLNNGNRQKAAFSFLGEIYEEAYRTGKSSDNLTKEKKKKIGDLRSDPAAQKNFEALVDNKMDGLMSRFRKDCPDLSDSDYRMSSYYFAGFDNTTVMIIMGIASLENTRSRKSYLRKKLSERYGKIGDLYSSIIGGVA